MPVAALGNADQLRQLGALVDQAMDLLVDAVDACADGLELHGVRRGGGCAPAPSRGLLGGHGGESDQSRRENARDGADPVEEILADGAVDVDERVRVLAP